MDQSQSRNCPICQEPGSLCCCASDPAKNLALKLVSEATDSARAKVTVKLCDLLVLCDRAYKWANDISKSIVSAKRRIEMPKQGDILLACGELNANELRAVKAALQWFIGRLNG